MRAEYQIGYTHLSERRDDNRIAERQTTHVERLLPNSPTFRFDKCSKTRRDERLEGARYVIAVGIENFEALVQRVANEQVTGLGTGQHRRRSLHQW
jgi:hypothetical protein